MLGLTPQIECCLFDLDGVLTQTAKVHAAAWKKMFDSYLRERAEARGEGFQPFDIAADYTAYVDGKSREDGIRSFLGSRGIVIPDGEPDDSPEASTVHGLGTRKNALVLEIMEEQGVEPYEGSVRYVEAVREQGLPCAVVSSSRNCKAVLESAGIAHLFDDVIDGNVSIRDGLAGKPAPDTYIAGARSLGFEPPAAVVYEDALAGVASGRAGGFGLVIGLNRADQAAELASNGADLVVDDLAELLDK